MVEARIDFSDEADVPENLIGPAVQAAQQLRDEIAAALADKGRGERLREGLVVAIAGPPNAGKSTLFNRVARREAAIVSPYAGTTRDVIEVQLDLGGYPVTLLDTAGIRDSDDPVEQEGVRRARARAAEADLVLWVTDVSARGGAADQRSEQFPDSEVWLIENKIDLAVQKCGGSHISKDEYRFSSSISAMTGQGTDPLIAALSAFAKDYFVRPIRRLSPARAIAVRLRRL